jgi:hypothetical protein
MAWPAVMTGDAAFQKAIDPPFLPEIVCPKMVVKAMKLKQVLVAPLSGVVAESKHRIGARISERSWSVSRRSMSAARSLGDQSSVLASQQAIGDQHRLLGLLYGRRARDAGVLVPEAVANEAHVDLGDEIRQFPDGAVRSRKAA